MHVVFGPTIIAEPGAIAAGRDVIGRRLAGELRHSVEVARFAASDIARRAGDRVARVFARRCGDGDAASARRSDGGRVAHRASGWRARGACASGAAARSGFARVAAAARATEAGAAYARAARTADVRSARPARTTDAGSTRPGVPARSRFAGSTTDAARCAAAHAARAACARSRRAARTGDASRPGRASRASRASRACRAARAAGSAAASTHFLRFVHAHVVPCLRAAHGVARAHVFDAGGAVLVQRRAGVAHAVRARRAVARGLDPRAARAAVAHRAAERVAATKEREISLRIGGAGLTAVIFGVVRVPPARRLSVGHAVVIDQPELGAEEVEMRVGAAASDVAVRFVAGAGNHIDASPRAARRCPTDRRRSRDAARGGAAARRSAHR